MDKEHPRVGVAVIVKHRGKILIGKRKGKHAAATWGFPGGALEMQEDPLECARRETLEEANVWIKNLRSGPYTNDIFKESGKHYVTLFIVGDYWRGKVTTMEPDKCEGWEWVKWKDLPKPLMLPVVHLLERGFDPFS